MYQRSFGTKLELKMRLYKALSREGNPEFATVLKVMQALGLRLKVAVERDFDALRHRKNSRSLVIGDSTPAGSLISALTSLRPKKDLPVSKFVDYH
jgi:hypothetical protein